MTIKNPLEDSTPLTGPVFTIPELSTDDVVLVFQPNSNSTIRNRVVSVGADVIQLETYPLNRSTPMQRVLTHEVMYELGFVHVGTMPGKIKRLLTNGINSF